LAIAKKKPAQIGRFQLHLLLQWHHTGHNLQVREPSQLKGHTHEMDGLVFGIERSWPEQELMGFESFFKKYKFNYFPVTIPKLRWLSNVCRHEFCQFYLSSYWSPGVVSRWLAGLANCIANSEKNCQYITRRKHTSSKQINFNRWSIILYSWLDITSVSVNRKNHVSCSAYLGEHLSICFNKIPILFLRQYL